MPFRLRDDEAHQCLSDTVFELTKKVTAYHTLKTEVFAVRGQLGIEFVFFDMAIRL